MISSTSVKRSPFTFFALVFALSIPFWLARALTSFELLPAQPVTSLMVVCPVTAAAILVYRQNEFTGVNDLLKRAFDFKRVTAKIWYVPTLLLCPCTAVLSYAVMRLLGVAVPAPTFSVALVLLLFVVYFIGALGEELGWSGYAIDPLQERFGALGGALLLGVVWTLWHWVPFLEGHLSLAFILWWSLGMVAWRVMIVWLYNNTGRSVFVAALFHAMINLSWGVFPPALSYYDPRVTSLITAIMAAVVVMVWGPHTLTRFDTHSGRKEGSGHVSISQ